MAKVNPSAGTAETRNKLGGLVYFRNKGGAVTRRYVAPTLVQTDYTQLIRDRVKSLSKYWGQNLTELQRLGWIRKTPLFKTSDQFGNMKQPSGIALFIKLNMQLLQASLDQIDDAPMPQRVVPLTKATISANVSTSEVMIYGEPHPTPGNQRISIFMTPPLSAGIYNCQKYYRFIGSVAETGPVPVNIFDLYTARFGALVAGKKIFIKGMCIAYESGCVSGFQQASCIIQSV